MKHAAPAFRALRRWLPPVLAVLVVAALLGSIFRDLQRTAWCVYTDGFALRRPALECDARPTLWDEPRVARGDLGGVGDDPQPAFAGDDVRVVFTRGLGAATNADLFTADWDGRVWTNVVTLAGVNTPSNEVSPALSADAGTLLFASDRPGGHGGYDLWAAVWNGTNWTGVTNLGPSVNTAYDEQGPALTRDGASLWFASNRPRSGGAGGGFDIYMATAAASTSTVALSAFGAAAPVDTLNSPADDVEPCPTPRGDRLWFASNRQGGLGGFDLYHARLHGAADRAVVNAGSEINSAGDDTAPAVRMEGFDLLFGSNRDAGGARGFAAYGAAAREVLEGVDLTRWHMFKALLNRIKWWVLVLVAAVALLVYLLRHYRDLTSLFHKCLMVSVILHVLILLLAAIWIISSEMVGGMEPKTMEITLSVDSLAREKLALNMREEVTELPPSDVSLVIEQTRDPVPMPEFTPRTVLPDLPPTVTRTHAESLVTFVTPSAPAEGVRALPALKTLEATPPRARPQVDLTLEMAAPEPLSKADPAVEEPKADEVMAKVKVVYKPTTAPRVTPVRSVVDPASVSATAVAEAAAVKVRDTGGKRVVASAGLEAKGQLPELKGSGDIAGLLVKHAGAGQRVRMLAPGQLDLPEAYGQSVSPQLLANPGQLSTEIVEALGGSGATQGAIGQALDWFTRNQESDGRWDILRHGGKPGHDVATTSLALLCYYGWGAKHNVDGPYRDVVGKALNWLLAQVQADGDLRQANRGGDMYDQGMAAIALCEAYGMTKDPRLRPAASNAVAFVCAAQSAAGGWRYTPGQDGDLSVFGWQYMALRSAELAGLAVPAAVLEKADAWLKRVSGGKDGGIYGYQGVDLNRPAMIPTGMFCRQLARVRPDEPHMAESVDYMRVRSPFGEKGSSGGNLDYYYLYYGTLALYQQQGPVWDGWNNRMKEVLVSIQNKTGRDAGSWSPSSGGRGKEMGRAVTTAFATLSLEVYYRILPIYGFRKETAPERLPAIRP